MKYFLVVRQQNNQLGDLLCSVPMYLAIKKKYPESHITLITAPTNYDIPFKVINPYIDDIIKFKKDSLKDYLVFLKDVRKTKFDIGIVPSTLKISRTSNIINFLSGAKIRVGVKRIDNEYNKLHYLLNVKGEFNWNSNKVHQLYRVTDVVKQIGCTLSDEEIKNVEINIGDEEVRFANEFIKNNFSDSGKPIFGFHPGAGKEINRWNLQYFLELIELLYKRFSCNVLLTSGYIDKEITFDLVKALREKNIEPVIAENFEIKKLSALFKRINLYITNDTGVMHLAGFSGTNVISLFGPTNGFEWAPVKKNQFFIQSETGNINEITPERVMNLVLEKYEF
ncbi:MAG TPA: glycosyltransferase family 9 protein [Ignavibacteria bacterium]